MNFRDTPIEGVYAIEIEPHLDARGFFARTWCEDEFSQRGLDVNVVQTSISRNRLAGTVRGLHFAWPPSREAKVVRCGRGKVFDVVLDLRPTSRTFLRRFWITLDDDQQNALYVSAGVAHGFQTLVDNCDVLYMMTDIYRPELADGVRFDDPLFGIEWPRRVSVIADRDRDYPDFDSARHIARYGARNGDVKSIVSS